MPTQGDNLLALKLMKLILTQRLIALMERVMDNKQIIFLGETYDSVGELIGAFMLLLLTFVVMGILGSLVVLIISSIYVTVRG